tara:strand:- start:352 stop:798 length:447 start_codon:yes stop_codon:yes gene_type:complete
MINFFRQNKKTATLQVWNELCLLDNFLDKDLGNFIQSQTHLDISQWEFVNKPLSIIEKERANIKYELYSFAKNEIFVNTLQPDINILLEILRDFLSARQSGDQGKQNVQLTKFNLQLNNISKNYLKKLNEFRDLAEKLTDEKFEISLN